MSTPRTLRPRREGQSFAGMFQIPDSDEEMGIVSGSSDGEGGSRKRKRLPAIEEPVTESEYDPEDEPQAAEGTVGSASDAVVSDFDEGEEDQLMLLEDDDDVLDMNELGTSSRLRVSRSSRPGAAPTSSAKKQHELAIASFNFTQKRPGNRSAPSNPTLNVTRNRVFPLFVYPGLSRRLSKRPSPFEKPELVQTNGYHGVIGNRVGKGWGASVFPGPVWELLEDMGYYKEIEQLPNGERKRPVTHLTVSIPNSACEVVDVEHGSGFLPSADTMNDDGSWKPPPPINCLFGPYQAQVEATIQPFSHLKLSTLLPTSKSHILNAGGPVWGLGWCPVNEDALEAHDYTHYLAVATYPTAKYSPLVSSRLTRPSPASIQIWSFGPGVIAQQASPAKGSPSRRKKPTPKTVPSSNMADAQANLSMVLCVDCGPANDIKWCPLPSHDSTTKQKKADVTPKIGLLAGVFGDGTVSIFAVPDPQAVRKDEGTTDEEPVYVQVGQPVVRIELPDAVCTAMDWANSEVLAVGASNGNVLVYNIKEALLDPQRAKPLLPTCYIHVTQVAIRSIAWIRAPPADEEGNVDMQGDPQVLATTSYDGSMYMTDVRDPSGHVVFRARDLACDVASGPYVGGAVASEHENILKSFSNHADMLGRGHTVSETKGPVWRIGTSDYHPYIATGAADGSCITTNLLKPTRRGGAVAILIHKIFQMDYNRNTGQYQMLQNFIPLELSEGKKKEKSNAAAKEKEREDKLKPYSELDNTAQRAARSRDGSGGWATEIGVHRVAWNTGSGHHCAALLASGMACGLVRIDFLEGRFHEDKVVYGDIETLRGEGDRQEIMDVDDEYL